VPFAASTGPPEILLRRLRHLVGIKRVRDEIVAARRAVGDVHDARVKIDPESAKMLPRVDATKRPTPAGLTPLMVAAGTGDLEAVKKLLAGGAPVDQADEAGSTPLMRWMPSVDVRAVCASDSFKYSSTSQPASGSSLPS